VDQDGQPGDGEEDIAEKVERARERHDKSLRGVLRVGHVPEVMVRGAPPNVTSGTWRGRSRPAMVGARPGRSRPMTPSKLAETERGLPSRAVAAAVVIAAIVGALVPYVLLRTGFGPNTSLFSTLLGFALVSIVGRARRSDLHAAQVAGVAAGQT